jgi:hypothetical protein
MADVLTIFMFLALLVIAFRALTIRSLPQSPSGSTAPPSGVAAPARMLTGTVTNEREEPLAGAQVTVDGHTERDITTSSGSFSLTMPASTAERVRLRVRKEGYQAWNDRVSVPSRNVPIQLRKTQ